MTAFPEQYFLDVPLPDPWVANPKAWRDSVLQTLITIATVDAGRVLLQSCQAAGRWILITPSNDCNSHGYAVRRYGYGAFYGSNKRLYTGLLRTDPNGYRTGSACYKLKDRGPYTRGFDPDEVMFHELVHAHRSSLRLSLRPPDHAPLAGGLKWYGNEEEFLAIVLTNIYISDATNHRRRGLRADWYGGRLLDPAFSTSTTFFESSQQILPLLQKFKDEQNALFLGLAGVHAAFNPLAAMLRHPDQVAKYAHSAIAHRRERTVPKLPIKPAANHHFTQKEMSDGLKATAEATLQLAEEALEVLRRTERLF